MIIRRITSLIAAGLLILAVAACAGPPSTVGSLINAATSTITNPVNATDIYRVKNAYAAALTLADDYRTFCNARPYKTLMADPIAKPICASRRPVERAIQTAKANAKAAIVAAQNFIRDNPTLNAATAIGAAWKAVQDFQASVPKTH